jgi:hypothetical protein
MRASSCFRPAELGGCSVASEVFNAASEARRFSFFEKRWGRSAFRGAVLRAKILHARAEVSMAAGVAGAERGPLTASTGVLSFAVAKDARSGSRTAFRGESRAGSGSADAVGS